ncbi:hypothetical protein H6F42_16005 [Pseudanabaena sp. FACHB-1998]|uniref:hypothetical protein n=1 Tax=Pseudanabaena sp. FACHB-1998 TaxID=2692858 RepID=UPI001681628C|nr:hypothetical protein [Pseudanabaena sp. FACHB-1998]MBD2178423.1 hypothetical protein [Pseudanabaena sp. FACHB-1998]
MDIVAVTSLISSCLPSLLKLGDKAAEIAGSKIGEDAWATAKKIWEKLRPKVEEKKVIANAVEAVVESPEDEDCKEFFQKKLQKLIEENQDLTEAIAKILQESAPLPASVQINQTVTNNQGQVIGQMTGGKAIGRIDGNIQGGVNL